MEKAELMKAGAQDYIHTLACNVATALKGGLMESEKDFNQVLHFTIRGYLEAGILTEAEATQPICEAYRESFSQAEEKEKTATSNEMWESMRKTALGDLHGIYEAAAKARIDKLQVTEVKYLTKATVTAQAYNKLGLITEEDRHNQYVSAYKVDYDIDVD